MFRIPPRIGENPAKALLRGTPLSSARTGSNSPPASFGRLLSKTQPWRVQAGTF